MDTKNQKDRKRLPAWLRQKDPLQKGMLATRNMLKNLELNTVCQSARCPNIGECYSKKTATFMILGQYCTRNCRFCSVTHRAVNSSCSGSSPANTSVLISSGAFATKLR